VDFRLETMEMRVSLRNARVSEPTSRVEPQGYCADGLLTLTAYSLLLGCLCFEEVAETMLIPWFLPFRYEFRPRYSYSIFDIQITNEDSWTNRNTL